MHGETVKFNCDTFSSPVYLFNIGMYHTHIIIVYTMGSHIARTLKVLDLYKMA